MKKYTITLAINNAYPEQNLIHTMAEIFGGCTVTEHLGAYVMKDGQLVQEIVHSYAGVALEDLTDKQVRKLKQHVQLTAAMYSQESVLFEVSEVDAELIFVK